MTDPLRRDPAEFLRVLRKMSEKSSWQKAMIFASKGRMIGYRLTLEHYNTVLFSQSLWGRALEIIRVIKVMQEDKVQPNGASYYYICHGMANADHGYNYDFPVNHKLPALQHWRVAIDALLTCEHNGFDSSDTMHNSCIVACTVPSINQWRHACLLLHKMTDENRKLHATMVEFFHKSLMKNWRPREASELIRRAAMQKVQGYEEKWEPDVFLHRPEIKTSEAEWTEERGQIEKEMRQIAPSTGGIHDIERDSVFRPRVYRQLWWKWHAVANKYRPHETLRRRQLAAKDSPTGIPAWSRL